MVLACTMILFTPGTGLIQSLIQLTMRWLIWLTLTAAMVQRLYRLGCLTLYSNVASLPVNLALQNCWSYSGRCHGEIYVWLHVTIACEPLT
jgi:hypothetical protein